MQGRVAVGSERNVVQRRKAVRQSRPELRVLITGQPYSTVNWSVGGILLRNYSAAQRVGDQLAMVVAAERSNQYARLQGSVVRIDRRQAQLAVAFGPVPPGSMSALESFLKQPTAR